MKIVILSDDFPPESQGGAGIVAFMQAKELSKRGHEVFVITTFQEGGNDEKIDLDGLTVYKIHANYSMFFRAYLAIFNPQTVFKAKNILKELRPDVVHAHNLHQFLSYHVLSYARLYSKKVFITFHDVMSFHYTKLYPKKVGGVYDYKVSALSQLRYFGLEYNPFRNPIIKRYLRTAVDKRFAVSHSLKDALDQNGIKGVEVLHNGIDVEDFKYNEEDIKKFKDKYDLHGKKFLFFSGRISRAKGIDVCINLIKEISKTIPEVRLLIAGQENNYVKEILNRKGMIDVKDKIIFTGWLNRREVISAYYSSDLVPVLSLYLDPFPTTNLEAMATRRPVLGTCLGGTPEIVVDNETGFIVDPNNFGDVLKKTVGILSDDALSEKFGNSGYDRILEKFQIKDQIDILEKKYADY